jgi:hypothetical protein
LLNGTIKTPCVKKKWAFGEGQDSLIFVSTSGSTIICMNPAPHIPLHYTSLEDVSFTFVWVYLDRFKTYFSEIVFAYTAVKKDTLIILILSYLLAKNVFTVIPNIP